MRLSRNINWYRNKNKKEIINTQSEDYRKKPLSPKIDKIRILMKQEKKRLK